MTLRSAITFALMFDGHRTEGSGKPVLSPMAVGVGDDLVDAGAYPMDALLMSTCEMPDFVVSAHDTLPFYIPFRALTNEKYGNLLMAGKTMAQSFLADAATRLHPIEWSTGTAAADMASSRDELERIKTF